MKLELDPVNPKRKRRYILSGAFFFWGGGGGGGGGFFVLSFRVVDSRFTLRSSVLETVRVKYCSKIFLLAHG